MLTAWVHSRLKNHPVVQQSMLKGHRPDKWPPEKTASCFGTDHKVSQLLMSHQRWLSRNSVLGPQASQPPRLFAAEFYYANGHSIAVTRKGRATDGTRGLRHITRTLSRTSPRVHVVQRQSRHWTTIQPLENSPKDGRFVDDSPSKNTWLCHCYWWLMIMTRELDS